MSGKRCAILALMACAAMVFGMANPASAALASGPGSPDATWSTPADARLFDEAAGPAPLMQMAANTTPSLTSIIANNTVMSQSQCDLIYLDFRGTPDDNNDGRPDNDNAPYEVTFFDASTIPEEFGEPETIEWFPLGFILEDGTFGPTIIQDVEGGQDSVTFRYEEAGIYDVCFRIQINGEWCPPRGNDANGDPIEPFCKDGFVVVTEEDTDQPPTATFSLTDLVSERDKEALVPLNDWVPLWNFTMGYSPDEPAPRFLQNFRFRIRRDLRSSDDLGYRNVTGPTTADLLEFGIFEESFSGTDADQRLDNVFDDLILTFDSNAQDRFGRLIGTVNGIILPNGTLASPLIYNITLTSGGFPIDPGAPVEAGPETDTSISGNSYILAVRTSALWQSGYTMSTDWLGATMVPPGQTFPPRDDEGELIDGLPDFPVEIDLGYSSSFSVYDITGGPASVFVPEFVNAWSQPRFGYSPTQEWLRPRFDLSFLAFEVLGATLLDIRQLDPLEQWVAVAGINVHSGKPVHFDFDEAQTQFFPGQEGLSPGEIASYRRDGFDKEAAQLQEVNLVVTDIGADPAEPGSGGLDPRDAFNDVINAITRVGDVNAISSDLTFSGINVFYDTNNNAIFDPPIPFEGGSGVDMTNSDQPLIPLVFVDDDIPNGDWEYVPFPPEGGDPWWKIKLRFGEGQRRPSGEITDADNTVGYVEAIPDGGADDSPIFMDYFVVVRPDSGYVDASTIVGDEVGMPLGADYRVFVEPRRYNPLSGHEDGGIYVNSMIPPIGARFSETALAFPWQDDHRWGEFEPWWNQRSVNINNTKPLRHGIEVHDLVLAYESTSRYAGVTDFNIGGVVTLGEATAEDLNLAPTNVTGTGGFFLSSFDQWIDPLGLQASKFFYGYTVFAPRWYVTESVTFSNDENSLSISFSDGLSVGQFAYEQAPFLRAADFEQGGPRSNVFANPPEQPTLPDYATWPRGLATNEYPRENDWPVSERRTRMLTQKTDVAGDHTAMLGINLVNSIDPRVNEQRRVLNQLTVAFWGPEFEPSDLSPLDPTGVNPDSGVMLWEDTDSNGIFIGQPQEALTQLGLFDEPLRLTGLRWADTPELIDLDGDGSPDDMNGDGVVDTRDRAWVLRMVPEQSWVVPDRDFQTTQFVVDDDTGGGGGGDGGAKDALTDALAETAAEPQEPKLVDFSEVQARALAKLLDPTADHGGDDLFVSVRFSETASRFEKVRAVIPASLPQRAGNQQRAGVQFFPEVKTAPDAFVKRNPEEDPVQDYYGHDMLEANVPVKITRLTGPFDQVSAGGPPVAMLGIDTATNRDLTLDSGTDGTGLERRFSVDGAGWSPGAFEGQFLIDSRYESYEITGNTNNQLELLSGQPENGEWRIVTSPTFLEQIFVEFYPEFPDITVPDDGGDGGDGGDGDDGQKQTPGFNPEDDLLPLDIDPEVSGVALYRDNDFHPQNRNGIWDPGIDLPVTLDAAPDFIGQPGEPQQVRMVFSTPGVDDHPIPRAQQPRNRQWVPDDFGENQNDANFGPEFFIVVRPSNNLTEGDSFSIGLVGWGPNTPTAPDPDNWTSAWQPNGQPLPLEVRDEFIKFQDFPWADHALGFVTLLDEPAMYYYFENSIARREMDESGYNYIRSSTTRKVQSNTLTAEREPTGPTSVVIQDTQPSNGSGLTELPSQTLEGESVTFIIAGQGFGTRPQVQLSGYDVVVDSATNTQIQVTVTVREGIVPSDPVVLTVRNPDSGRSDTRNDLFDVVEGSPLTRPQISGVAPRRADSSAFPVQVNGANFDSLNGVRVRFGSTSMPVVSVTGDAILVGFPTGGIAVAGTMDVQVTNMGSGLETVAAGAFEYVNEPVIGRKSLLCGPDSGTKGGNGLSDVLVMLLTTAMLAGLGLRRTRKP